MQSSDQSEGEASPVHRPAIRLESFKSDVSGHPPAEELSLVQNPNEMINPLTDGDEEDDYCAIDHDEP